MQNSPSRKDSSPPSHAGIVVGIDPGHIKCGYAAVSLSRTRLALEIVRTVDLADRLGRDVQDGCVRMICLGDATRSEAVEALIRARWPHVPVTLVDERNTSLEARRRYYEDHPPRGLWRLVPRGLLVPSEQLDGYAALLIIERFLAQNPLAPA